MTKETIRRGIAFFLAIVGLVGLSEAGGQEEALSLSLAVEYALEANPDVQRAREQIDEFDLMVRQARAEAFPQVDANVAVVRTRDPGLRNSPFFSRLLEGPDPVPPEALAPFFFTNYLWRFDVSQSVYSFGRVTNAMKAARDELGGIRMDVREKENEISRDVARACYGFLLARRRLEVLESERAARERQLQNVRDRFELQDATRLDLLRAEVTLANLRPEILSAENDVRVAVALVNDALGRPVDMPLVVEVPLEAPERIPSVAEPAALMLVALENRPRFLRYGVDRRVLEDRVGITRAAIRPAIDATASYGINTYAFDNLSDLAFRSWSFGVSMRWTLFDGLRTPSEIGALRSQVTQSRREEESFRSELALELERSSGNWRRALEAIEVASMAVEQAREAERVAEESFRWGAATTLDLLESARSLREAEFNQAQAAHDALVALAELKFLVGFRADAPDSVLEGAGSGAGMAESIGVLQ